MSSCDVLVVGAGPAGSASAILFAEAGYHVRVLERAVFPRPKPCGDFLSPEGSRILRRLGVERDVRAAGAREVRGLLVSAYGEPAFRADFQSPESRFGYALERRLFDEILARRAAALGADVLEGCTVEALGPRGEVRARTADGEPVSVRARLIVGAGGKRCPVARALNLQRRRGEGRVDLLCHWRTDASESRYCEMLVFPPGYAGMVAAAPGVVNVNVVVPGSWLRAQAANGAGGAALRRRVYGSLITASPRLRRALAGATPVYEPVASDVTPLFTRRATADGVLLAGDSALFIDPFTGQGLYLALRSAELAFEVGSGALSRGDTDALRLAEYDRLRNGEFGPKVLLSRLLQAILYRPSLARRVTATLRRDRRGASRLVAAIGDYRPPGDLLAPAFLARLAAAGAR